MVRRKSCSYLLSPFLTGLTSPTKTSRSHTHIHPAVIGYPPSFFTGTAGESSGGAGAVVSADFEELFEGCYGGHYLRTLPALQYSPYTPFPILS